MTLTAPNKKPQQFGFKAGDTHLVVNAATETMTAWDYTGKKLWTRPCRAMGQHPNWRNNSGDTPPGLYKFGQLYNDRGTAGDNPSYDRTLMAYGWMSFDMVDLEGNEDNLGRAGIMLHGGGTGCGWPGAWAERQQLYPTLGCLRAHNADLWDYVYPRYEAGTVFVSVYQDDA